MYLFARLYELSRYQGLIALIYPPGTVSGTVIEQLEGRENTDSDSTNLFSEAVLWKAEGDDVIYQENTGKKKQVSFYQMKGQIAAVFMEELSGGRFFTQEEVSVCLLDQGTARELFGSEDVAGMKLKCRGQEIKITGILKCNEPVCIVQGTDGTDYDGIALRKAEEKKSSGQAFDYAEILCGGVEKQRIDGYLYYMTGFWMLIFSISFFLLLFGMNRRKKRICFVFCIVLAIELFVLGAQIVPWGSDYLPARWSDFDFFVQLFTEKKTEAVLLGRHQEFEVWKKMLDSWRQVMVGSVIVIVCSFQTQKFS